MPSSRRPLSTSEQAVLDHLDTYVETTADDEGISQTGAVTYLSEQGITRADADELVEQLLLKGYLYEVDDELRIPPRI
ncbi:hypothetical protein [Halorussus amylolyticus]|uniref:hypothetical protein n=1 Tax=Halorussus amylolyticus TaxID=1126242 RepID=UPI0010532835|nr:hypothetical protein [Halorussus amylolyticus]